MAPPQNRRRHLDQEPMQDLRANKAQKRDNPPRNRKRPRDHESLDDHRPAKAQNADNPPQNRKRRRDHEPSEDQRPAKAQKTDKPSVQKPSQDLAVGDPRHWVYPPEFWDSLSTVPFTRSALREFDRRTRGQNHSIPPPPRPTGFAPDIVRRLTRASAHDLALLARHGGPDLGTLRGYPAPVRVPRDKQPATAMAPSTRSTSREKQSTAPTTVTKTRTSVYGPGFAQHVNSFGLRPVQPSTTDLDFKQDLEQVKKALKNPRDDLTPSKFSQDDFSEFELTFYGATNEDDVVSTVVPYITGSAGSNGLCHMNMLFNNMVPLTVEGFIPKPKPDYCWSADLATLNQTILDDLSKLVAPSTALARAAVPNFFCEVKGPAGCASVLMEQARYAGAVGARAVHSLQNYGRDKPIYDGKICSYTATFLHGTLDFYAHHVTAPETDKDGEPKYHGRPVYHMSPLASYSIKGNWETFVQGATAFRNLRDLAKKQRDSLILAQNSAKKQRDRLVAAQGTADPVPSTESLEKDGPINAASSADPVPGTESSELAAGPSPRQQAPRPSDERNSQAPPRGTRRRAAEPADDDPDGPAEEPEEAEDTPTDRSNSPRSRPANKRQRLSPGAERT